MSDRDDESTGTSFHASGTLKDFGFNKSIDFTSDLIAAKDVSVEEVLGVMYFNALIFVVFIASFEVLRRIVPEVYRSKQWQKMRRDSTESGELPKESHIPFDWVWPICKLPWSKVLQAGGLDAYMFLRYIRMCLRISAISALWGIIILFPTYGSGGGKYQHEMLSWYRLSMANVEQGSLKIWVPSVFLYLFTAYVCFVLDQEYKHFMKLRMEYLGGDESVLAGHINAQQQYSLMVENIPVELRSNLALFRYFDELFPGRVHSACIVMNLPDLERVAASKRLATRHLEKVIAAYVATGVRPTHIVGRPIPSLLGVPLAPLQFPCERSFHDDCDMRDAGSPPKGARVDAADYFTQCLIKTNREFFLLQKHRAELADTGNFSVRSDNWFSNLMRDAASTADIIIGDSKHENTHSSFVKKGSPTHLPSKGATVPTYSSFTDETTLEHVTGRSSGRKGGGSHTNDPAASSGEQNRPGESEQLIKHATHESLASADSPEAETQSFWRLMMGRLGLDFAMTALKYLHKHVDTTKGKAMSTTGFITFLDHESMATAACCPIRHECEMEVELVAPEPRDILWMNAHIRKDITKRKEFIANIVLTAGIVFWSIPLAAIQAFAKADQLARIPGMEWILTFQGGEMKHYINGYLPVIALLGLIMVLPYIFQWVALSCENRKTKSDVQDSIIGRYFYYQLANIYITVTAGSLWKSLADMIDHPAAILEILGRSIPQMVGYFMSFLVTKILSGLPLVLLRSGSLGYVMFLKGCFRESALTQREIDDLYYEESLLYGWEYPTQLLVIMIVFVYACISPIILPVGALYFLSALIVYKQQVCYVYTPIYQSGGKLFCRACDKTLVGLICSQLTFIGYSLIRGMKVQPIFVLPLPFITWCAWSYFNERYVKASFTLSLERATRLDRISDVEAASSFGEAPSRGVGLQDRLSKFATDTYMQPVLTEEVGRPMPYRRREEESDLHKEVMKKLRDSNRFMQGTAIHMKGTPTKRAQL